MKRLLAFLLAFCMLLSGCSQEPQDTGSQLHLYYAVKNVQELSQGDSIRAEIRSSYISALSQLLKLYFQGPEDDALYAPFPSGTEAISVSEEDGVPTLVLSDSFFDLQGVEFSVAVACLSKTVCDYTGSGTVRIEDQTGDIVMELSAAAYLDADAYQVETDQMFTLYFPSEDRRYILPELREATLSENESAEAYLLRELMSGPQSHGLELLIPEGTELLGVSTTGGICSVNFSQEFYDNAFDEEYGIYTTIFGIVDTLTGLDSVDSVRFLKDGESVNGCGIMLLGEPISWDGRVIGSVQATGEELDVGFYMLQRITGESFQVPVRIKQSSSAPAAEAVVEELLGFVPPQGFYNPIPSGTELLNISVSGSVCYLDLSQEFLPSGASREKELEAVWCLVYTLTGLDMISSVALTVEGESGGLNYVDLSQPLTRKNVSLD